MGGTAGCRACGRALAADALVCEGCGQLVFADLVAELVAQAEAAEHAGNTPEAVVTWRRVQELVPPSAQVDVEARIEALGRRAANGGGQAASAPGASVPLGWMVALAALLWKGKLLLAGLTKLPTLLSMFAAVAAYATVYGAPFAIGLVLSIYVHEMGHVAALRRFKVPATAPMFIPFVGAFIRSYRVHHNPVEDAIIGLAGPVWGVAAAVAAAVAGHVFENETLLAVARVGAVINVFNLIPVWQLDGGWAWKVLDRASRWLAVAALIAAYGFTHEGTILLVAVVAGGVALFRRDVPEQVHNRTLFTYVAVVAAAAAVVAWTTRHLAGVSAPI